MDAGSNGSPEINRVKIIRQQPVAIDRLETTAVESPATLVETARDMLAGASDQEGVGIAYGGVGLLAQHTSYYDGFAVILSLPQAAAVVIRKTKAPDHFVSFGEDLLDWHTEVRESGRFASRVGRHQWAAIVEQILDNFLPAHTFVEVSVVSSVPPGCMEAFCASLAVATLKAVADFTQQELPENAVDRLRDVVSSSISAEFSKAFLMVSFDAVPGQLAIIDTATEELLPFDAPASEALSWGLVEAETMSPRNFDFYHECGVKGEEALALLHAGEFSKYESFRDVQHVDLPRVVGALPLEYRSIVRHLVNENKRVQAMIGAIRGEDWQKLGGLLFISHSSVSNELRGTNEVIDFVVSEAENMSSDGIYGACMTGRGGYVLVVGLPLAMHRFMDALKRQLKTRFDREPNTLIL